MRSFHKIKTAVIGPATSDRLLGYGLKSDIIPESYRAESVIDAFRKENLKGKRILLPRAEEARAILPEELLKMGASVDEITAYRTRAVTDESAVLIKELKDKTIDLITFTSSSTVKNFAALLPAGMLEELMKDIFVAAIGPVTADTAKNMGFNVSIIAESFTIPGLCDAILQHYVKS
jgi:uroporphyrinogen III methyltransferase/synthase